MRLFVLASALAALVAQAGDDITPEKRAQLQRDQAKAAAAVEKKYGNKKPNELSADERRSLTRERAEAEKEVLDKAGVDSKEFARSGARQSREDRASTEAAAKELDAKEAAAAKGDGKKAAGGKKEIVIEKNGKTTQGGEPVNEAAELDKQMNLGTGKK